jgi:hypothetical protein
MLVLPAPVGAHIRILLSDLNVVLKTVDCMSLNSLKLKAA